MNTATVGISFPVLWAVAFGGATGSVLRYVVAQWLPRASGAFPVSTLLVNVIGSLLIGVLSRTLSGPGDYTLARAALMVGVCGGFTTFSAFSADFVALVQEGRIWRAAGYVAATVVIGIVAVVAGMAIGDRLVSPRGP